MYKYYNLRDMYIYVIWCLESAYFNILNCGDLTFRLFLAAEVAHTADFIDRMDKLFNTFNSRSTSSKAQMSHAYSAESGHKQFLLECLTWLESIKSKGKLYTIYSNYSVGTSWPGARQGNVTNYENILSLGQNKKRFRFLWTSLVEKICVNGNFFFTFYIFECF